MEQKETDFCLDCGAEFEGFHYCEYVYSLDEED